MAKVRAKPWMSKEMKQIFEDMDLLEDPTEVAEFLADLLTDYELRMIPQRWYIARLIWEGKLSYEEIAEKADASTTTVCRVSKKVYFGQGGFQKILKRIYQRKLSKEELEEVEEKRIRRSSRYGGKVLIPLRYA